MAKRARPASGKSNGFDQDLLKEIVGRYDELTENLASEKGAYMKRAQDIGKQKKNLFKEAKSRGIPTEELKNYIEMRDHVTKAQAIRDEMDHDKQQTLDMIVDALGGFADTPLGAAAVRKVQDREKASAAVDALTTH